MKENTLLNEELGLEDVEISVGIEFVLHGYKVKIEKTTWDEADVEEILYWSAEIEELKGLKVYGDTLEEVINDIKTAYDDWVEAQREWGREIPKPKNYKGEKWTIHIAY